MTLAVEDANAKLVDIVDVGVGVQERVDDRLVFHSWDTVFNGGLNPELAFFLYLFPGQLWAHSSGLRHMLW